MKKICGLIFVLSIFANYARATHNRAGEITYRQISAYNFEFTITTFTYSLSIVEQGGGRTELNINWGDNTTSVAPRISRIELPGNYLHNQYVIKHTFPGPGVYEIVMQDPNRNLGVLNIPNSVNVVFSVKTTMVINPQLGSNNTPVLLNNPIDKAALGMKFIHNPAAFDFDGDSLSYKLTRCLRDQGKPIENYSFPRMDPANANHPKDTIYVDPISGDMVWRSPRDTGIFNFAVNIEEWRKGVKIGNIVRDMQVEVHKSTNTPPVNPTLKNLCVIAGTKIQFDITATDNEDSVIMSSSGGPYVVDQNKAEFIRKQAGLHNTTSTFSWQTDYTHVRKQQYSIIVKSEDNNSILKLVDISNFSIHVVAPSPENLNVLPGNNSNSLIWSKSVCPNSVGYQIYRSTTPLKISIDTCTGGIPSGSGYRLVGSTSSLNDTAYIDNDQGKGLESGITYCYKITAIFKDGAESIPSEEICTTLIPGAPALIMTSVENSDVIEGRVLLAWIKPRVDTIPNATGPFEYIIYRSGPIVQNNFIEIKRLESKDLSDTSYLDSGFNTILYPYNYKVELYNNADGNRFIIGKVETASTLFPGLSSSDNKISIRFVRSDPWINEHYIIYRKNPFTSQFDSISSTDSELYEDKELANGKIYSYKIKAYGIRTVKDKKYSTINWSHINSAAAVDTVPPCPPIFKVSSLCDSACNVVRWQVNSSDCSSDIMKINIYYKLRPNDKPELIHTSANISDSVFRHTPPESLAGCYIITAVDSFNNESVLSNAQCVDVCTGYKLPNVFSPNNDNINDVYVSYNPNEYVKKVEMKIFNRWGKIVYQTTDPDIKWDGRDLNSKQFVSSGVYYYICDVYEPRLTLDINVVTTLVGFIHVFHNDSENHTLE